MQSSYLWIILSMAVYGEMHSLYASNLIKKSIARQYPEFYSRYYRFIYNIFAVVTLLPIGWLMLTLPDNPLYTIPYPMIIVTLLIQGAAGLAMVYTLMGTGAGSFLGWDQLMGKSLPPEKLKTDGFYRHVRHPLYTLGFIIIWLFPWMTANWLALIASTTIYLVVGALLEERKMLQQFGEEYAQYKARTPMLMPDLQKILKG